MKMIKLENLFESIFSFIFLLSFFFIVHYTQVGAAQNQNATFISINVGTVLDKNTFVGQMGLSCISMAFSDFYASHNSYKTRILLNNRPDSNGDVVAAASSALDLIKNVQVQAILGPVTSMEAEFVIELGDKAKVPIISFTATSPSLSSIRIPYFIRASLNDSAQVNAITSIVKTFGWRQAVPIYADNEFGEGIVPFLIDALGAINTRVPYRSVIPALATDDQIVSELYKLMTMQTRVFIVHMVPSLGSRFFIKAKELGMMAEGFVWIITDAMTNELNSLDNSVIDAMQGVLGVKPYVPQTKEVLNFTNRWKSKFQQDNPGVVNPQLNVFGLWAYDSATALAMAVEKAGAMNISFQNPNILVYSTDLDTLGTSQNGPSLLQAILDTTFIGLSGEFRFVDGQIQSPPYQIVNVIGSAFKEIGFWTAKNGLLRQLNLANSAGNSNLGTILWPGDTITRPKGWVIPTNGKKLRVGVPLKDGGFRAFVSIAKNPLTNVTKVTGYCIDIFDAVIASLPYAVSYEYIPFEKPDGQTAGTYDDLIYQVHLGNFDAVVGDVTIIANRSNYVDFSLPFTESGVSMFVPIERQPNNKNKAWLFVKPLTWDLWLTTFISFVVIGMLIWFLEHRINEEFRGPKSYQLGVVFWFAFCTMVFAHKEKIMSNLARFVLIIWFLVVLILTQAYTASLTSMLTVQQLQPTVTDVNQLIKNKEYVGYAKGSFVFGLLLKMGFDESRLLYYKSEDECDQLFAKGSGNGGIAAAFHEVPYIKLILAKYCTKYTMVQPTYKTDGFGFVFPIGSPLISDISRAILNVTEGDKMGRFENAWFARKSNCPDSLASISSISLDFESFWGLFLIVGIAAFFAFVIYLGMFLNEHWDIVTNPRYTIRSKIVILALRFDNKDLNSHTFRNFDLKEAANMDRESKERVVEANERMAGAEVAPQEIFSFHASPQANSNISPPSPCSSIQTEHNISFSREKGSTSLEMTPVIQQCNAMMK